MGRGWSAIGSNPAVMFGIALLLGGLPSIVITALAQSYQVALMRNPTPDSTMSYALVTAISGVMAFVLACIVQGALVRATIAASEGRRTAFAETAVAGLRVALPLIGLALIVTISVIFGFILLFVPGMMIAVIWSVAAPSLVAERTGVFGALGRSAELTKGVRWRVFGLLLILAVLYWILSSVLAGVMFATFGIAGMGGMAQTGLPLWWLAINAVLSAVVNMVWAVMLTSLYIELRDFKDGADPEKLADIFA